MILVCIDNYATQVHHDYAWSFNSFLLQSFTCNSDIFMYKLTIHFDEHLINFYKAFLYKTSMLHIGLCVCVWGGGGGGWG